MIEHHLIQKIQTQGPLRLDDFIAEALYHEQFGYYRTHHPIGRTGDFITSPEICSLFGQMIGLFFLDYWLRAGCPTPVRLIELGPGKGTLMADILQSFQIRPGIFENLTVHMVEISESLKNIQQTRLSAYPCVTWHKNLDTVPIGFTLILGNEFFDAFPIRQLWYDSKWYEQFVTYHNNNFHFLKQSLPTPPVGFTPSPPCWIEISPVSLSYAEDIAIKLKIQGGMGLFIDYGTAKEPWTGNSLQAMKNHQYCDVLSYIGKADITHHVDFLSLQNQFFKNQLTVFPLLTQRDFLIRLGLEQRLHQAEKNLSAAALKTLKLAIFRLIDPQFMGQLFKALVTTSPIPHQQPLIPAGF